MFHITFLCISFLNGIYTNNRFEIFLWKHFTNFIWMFVFPSFKRYDSIIHIEWIFCYSKIKLLLHFKWIQKFWEPTSIWVAACWNGISILAHRLTTCQIINYHGLYIGYSFKRTKSSYCKHFLCQSPSLLSTKIKI